MSGTPLPSQPIALTGVNYTLPRRETSAPFSLGGGGGNLQLSRQWMETAGVPGLLVPWETWEPSLGLPITVAPSLVSLEGQFVAAGGGPRFASSPPPHWLVFPVFPQSGLLDCFTA